VVYKAEDIQLKRTVALKFLPRGLEAHQAERARFLQEAQAAAALNHPNICTIYDIGSEGENQFIVMEFVDGKTLREKIAAGRVQITEGVSYAIQIGEALEEAHVKGIVHRDVKAENIMVNSKNQIKVMDFGLAKLKGSLKLTKTSSTVGTLAYMAPEQIQGAEVDGRSDIFSFGVVLFEMLTGHLPFRGEHEAAMMYSIVNEEAMPLQQYVPHASSELVHILNRALEKDPEDRYQSVHDMVIDLRRLRKETSKVSRPAYRNTQMIGEEAPPLQQKKRRRTLLVGGAVALMIVGLVSVLWLILGKSPPRLNPNGTTVRLAIPFKEINYPAVSRDGNHVAFPAKAENNGTWDVYLMHTQTLKYHQVTQDSSFLIDQVDLSQDGGRIVYTSLKPGSPPLWQVRIVPTEGGESRVLADTGYGPKWKPDGTRIGYIRWGKSECPSISHKLELWSVNPDGTDKRLEITDTVSNTDWASIAMSWSPDGGSIAWIRSYPQHYGEVMVRELATGKEQQLTSDRKKVDEVAWASNDEILFVSNKSGTANLWTIPASGGKPIQVTQGVSSVLGARISADSKTISYLNQEKIGHIWISAVDGSNRREVTTDKRSIRVSRFSPDKKQIAFSSGGTDRFDFETHLFVVDRDGTNLKQLTPHSDSEIVYNIQWSPDGRRIAFLAGRNVDSLSVFLVQPQNPGPPRMLCLRSGAFLWIDNEWLAVYQGTKTMRYSVNGAKPTQVFQDSTFAFPLEGGHQIVYWDYRGGDQGPWVVSVDEKGKPNENARNLNPGRAVSRIVSINLRVAVFLTDSNELVRVWIPTGKVERMGRSPVPFTTFWLLDVSGDGRELLWIEVEHPSTLVLVKDAFE
jgi:serine/threonine protein kinase